jgi:phospholipid/cholesterol/gamma-HCH transport system substrate-binding protein
MNTIQASTSTKFRVGVFTALTLALIGAITVFVNDKPFWWRSCQLVHINVEDATGLKAKSPVRSLGLQIGYLQTVELTETYVRLGICVTAPVEVLSDTKAFIRGEGFLGDKFVELKPVKYVGPKPEQPVKSSSNWLDRVIPEARASEGEGSAGARRAPAAQPPAGTRGNGRDIPVGENNQDVTAVVNQVQDLVKEMTSLTTNLKQSINPQELRQTMTQLNRTLEAASKTLSPEGGLNTTAQRTLAKLEDAIEQLRDQMTRINKGEGSVGMLLNDPAYADEIRDAIRNVNRLLSKVGGIRFVVDLGAEQIAAFDGSRGWFKLKISPKPDRYYLLGISVDPRGKLTVINTTTTSGGSTVTTQQTSVEQSGLLFTAMLGKVYYNRIDLSVGALHGDGTASVAFHLGPAEHEDMLSLRSDTYSRGRGFGLDDRLSVSTRPFPRQTAMSNIYVRGGLESVKKVDNRLAYFYGAGLTFDDDDIKLLFSLR